MALKIRLKRIGAKNRPFYRLVVADSRMPRDGRFVETLGIYDPIKNPAVINIDEEKTLNWLQKGARPSETAKKLLSKSGLWKKFTEMNQRPRKEA